MSEHLNSIPTKNTGDYLYASEFEVIRSFIDKLGKSLGTFNGSNIVVDSSGSYNNITYNQPTLNLIAGTSVTSSGNNKQSIKVTMQQDCAVTFSGEFDSDQIFNVPNSNIYPAGIYTWIFEHDQYNNKVKFYGGYFNEVSLTDQAKIDNLPTDTNASLALKADLVGGKVPSSQLPDQTSNFYLGGWNASTNTPSISDGSGTNGQFYIVEVGGTQDLGSGSKAFTEGGKVYYENTNTWEPKDPVDAVASVNGQTGVVVLDKTDIGLSNVENKSSATIRSEIVDADIPSTIARDSEIPTALADLSTDINNQRISLAEKTQYDSVVPANQAEAETASEDVKYLSPLTGYQGWLSWITNKTVASLDTVSKNIVAAINEIYNSALLTTSIDTLAKINSIITDATLIDTGDSRLSDSRTPTDGSVTNAKLATEVENRFQAVEIDPSVLTPAATLDLAGKVLPTMTLAANLVVTGLSNVPSGGISIRVIPGAYTFSFLGKSDFQPNSDGEYIVNIVNYGTTASPILRVHDGVGVKNLADLADVTSTGPDLENSLKVTQDIRAGKPIALAVSISGTEEVGQTLTANHSYWDALGRAESGTTYQWWRADVGGGNPAAISGATSQTYTLVAADVGKIVYCVITVANATIAGSAYSTPYSGTITEIVWEFEYDFVTATYSGSPNNLPSGWVQLLGTQNGTTELIEKVAGGMHFKCTADMGVGHYNNPTGVAINQDYEVQIDIDTFTSGAIYILGLTTPSPAISTSGTHTHTINTGSWNRILIRRSGSGSDCVISNIRWRPV